MAAVLAAVCCAAVSVSAVSSAVAQGPTNANAEQEDGDQLGVVVGIRGHYRVGRTTAVRLIDAGTRPIERDRLSIETLDGDGVRVQFAPYPAHRVDPVDDTERGRSIELGYVVPGSEAAPLEIHQITGDEQGDEVLLKTRFPIRGLVSRGPSMIDDRMPWMVAIGDPLGIDQIGVSNVLLDKEARIAVTKVDSSADLPYQSLGYAGVDLVMINASGLPVLSAMKPAQVEALSGWLRGGGRLFLCLGEASEELRDSAPWLIGLLPFEEVEIARYDPAALETYTASQTPLSVFEGIRLPKAQGRITLTGRTTRRVSAVLAADYIYGFGKITVVAADLDRQAFRDWPERLGLVTQLVGELFEDQESNRDVRDGTTSFGDLAGQMRGVLDQFSIKPSFSFSIISLVLMVLIAAVGPLDYLLVNRVLGKPLLGWLSFPLVAIALSALLVLQSAPKGDDSQYASIGEPAALASMPYVRANQFQITDIDLVEGTGRGFAWTSLYSHDPLKVNLQYVPGADFDAYVDKTSPRPTTFTYPMGYPGRAFGGAQRAGENTVLPMYSVAPFFEGKTEGEGVRTTAVGVTVAPRSSKSFASCTEFTPDPLGGVAVSRRPGSELLRGNFVNPLPVDLLDGMLVYGNWVYLLPTRVPAGASVGNLNELRQKNFRWRLTRQQTGEENVTETTPWSPGDFTDAARVAEMVLFHRSAGGDLYTGLRHDVLGGLDLSEVLVEDRCMLIGRTEKPVFDLSVTSGDWKPEETVRPGGNVLSMVRLILPVRTTRLN